MAPLLSVRDLCAGYGAIEALHGVNIEIDEGQLVAIIGANGAGKSTLLRTISGLIRPTRGTIEFEGAPLSQKEPHDIVAMGILHVAEGRGILTRMTVLENLKMGAFLRRDTGEINRDVESMFETFPWLEERRKQLGGTLSGGQQQMLAIARALMARPRLLMLDEPSLGLAPMVVQSIFKLVGDLKKRNTTILLVEQNTRGALRVSDYGYVMAMGKIVMKDSAEVLLASDKLVKAYLGGRSAA
ncbi:MAG: ABC transporter ATP-binding protein [Chloroflexi bacterium]|nr:ABC transporter ATP-binding protein [Chloroflexota bacterium]